MLNENAGVLGEPKKPTLENPVIDWAAASAIYRPNIRTFLRNFAPASISP